MSVLAFHLERRNLLSDEQLDGRVGDSDGLEHCVEVVRDETVAGPLREERDGDHDPQTSPVPWRLEQGQPANVGGLAIEGKRGPNLLKLVLDERVVPMLNG